MATGIVVRAIAPLLGDKLTDPCVIVLDEKGRHAISLLSGHIGGGNALARKIAALLGGTAVITTASDTLELVALDLWANKQHLHRSEPGNADELYQAFLSIRDSFLSMQMWRSHPYRPVYTRSMPPEQADFVVSHLTGTAHACPIFIPRNLVVGIGCNRGTPVNEFEDALERAVQ